MLDGRPPPVTIRFGNRPLCFQRQRDTPLPEYFIDNADGIQCLRKTDKRCALIDCLTQFDGRDTRRESCCCMGFELGQGLHHRKHRTSNQFAGLQVEIAHSENFPENVFLENIHQLRIRPRSRKRVTPEQGGIVFPAKLDSVHSILFLNFLRGSRPSKDSQQKHNQSSFHRFSI